MQQLPAKKTSNYGFTLMEILVAIAILSVLAAAFIGNLFPALVRGRDSRRKQDLRSIAQSLELYYNDNRVYPTAYPTPGLAFTHPADANVIYLRKVPGDPVSTKRYCYTSTDGTSFRFYANLDNTKDTNVIPTPVACGGTNYNYGVSSPNVNP